MTDTAEVTDLGVKTSNMETQSALPLEETERLGSEIVAALKSQVIPAPSAAPLERDAAFVEALEEAREFGLDDIEEAILSQPAKTHLHHTYLLRNEPALRSLGEAKPHTPVFRELAARHPGAATVAYGNTASDLPHMLLADRAVMVNPHAGLRAQCAAADIETVRW